MKKQKVKLELAYSCNQKWNDLEGSNEEKFCSKCSKNVTNLIGKSDFEILQLLEEGNTCVRLSEKQLNKNYVIHTPSKNLKLTSYKSVALATLTFFGLNSEASETNIFLQSQSAVQADYDNTSKPNLQSKKKDSTHHRIKGNVISEATNEPIPFVNILIVNSKNGTTTDFDGNFELEIPENLKKDTITIQLSMVGYDNSIVHVTEKDFHNGFLSIKLKENLSILTGSVVIIKGDKKRNRRNRKRGH